MPRTKYGVRHLQTKGKRKRPRDEFHSSKRHRGRTARNMEAIESEEPMALMAMSSGANGGADGNGGRRQARKIPNVDGKLQWGFPTRIITDLRYIDVLPLTFAASPAVVANVFRMNSVFDPDFTNAGHQPQYFDVYASIYDNYRVHGCQLEVTFVPNPTTDNGTMGPWMIGINGSDSSTALASTARTRSEQSDAYHEALSREDGARTLIWNYNPADKLGQNAMDDTMGALVTSNPTQEYFAHVWASDITGTTANTVYIRVELKYSVEFFKLKQQSQN